MEMRRKVVTWSPAPAPVRRPLEQASFAQELDAGLDERPLQIAVVVALLLRNRLRAGHPRKAMADNLLLRSLSHGFEPLRLEGQLPDDLRGTLYRAGPGLFERFGTKLAHPFEADGAVTAVRLGPSGALGASRRRLRVAQSFRGRSGVPSGPSTRAGRASAQRKTTPGCWISCSTVSTKPLTWPCSTARDSRKVPSPRSTSITPCRSRSTACSWRPRIDHGAAPETRARRAITRLLLARLPSSIRRWRRTRPPTHLATRRSKHRQRRPGA